MRSPTHDTQRHHKILILRHPEWKAIAKAQTHYRKHEVKPANPFLILRRPGDYA